MASPDGRPVSIPRVPWHETEDGVRYKITPLTDWQEAKEAAIRKYSSKKTRKPNGKDPLVNL